MTATILRIRHQYTPRPRFTRAFPPPQWVWIALALSTLVALGSLASGPEPSIDSYQQRMNEGRIQREMTALLPARYGYQGE